MNANKKKKFEIGKYLDDLLVAIGCGLILTGVYKFFPEAILFVSGTMLIVTGLVIAIGNRKAK